MLLRFALLLLMSVPAFAEEPINISLRNAYAPSVFSNKGLDITTAVSVVMAELEADPNTDWDAVNLDALLTHLADLDMVLQNAYVQEDALRSMGYRFSIDGDGPTIAALRRVLTAHIQATQGSDDWHYEASFTGSRVELLVHSSGDGYSLLSSQGFLGMLLSHELSLVRHMAIATGEAAYL